MKYFVNFLPKLFILLVFVILISGCTTENEIEINPTNSLDETEAYPGPVVEDIESNVDNDSGYPVDDSTIEKPNDLPVELEIPTPDESSGVVIGKMITETDNEPYIAPRLYLGSYIVAEEDVADAPPLIGISVESDPVAQQAQDGSFVFANIQPGNYILLIWSPMNIVPAEKGDGQGEIVVSVEAGKVIDLGTVFVP